MRYTRLKNSIISIPPIEADQMFRVDHDAKRLYYIGEEDGVKKLVIVWLKDLSHRSITLGEYGTKIKTLEHSSLLRNYLCFQIEEREEKMISNILFYSMKRNFFVIDIKTQELVWELPDCEKVFFKGADVRKLGTVDFEDRFLKMRNEDEEESEFEEPDDEDGPKLVLEDEDSEELSEVDEDDIDPEERLESIHKGIMVIKCE